VGHVQRSCLAAWLRVPNAGAAWRSRSGSGVLGVAALVSTLLVGTASAGAEPVAPRENPATSSPAAEVPASPQPPEAVRLDLPPQPLPQALDAVARELELELVYDASEIPAVEAPALQGSFTPEQAMGRLLDGTSLTHRFVEPRRVVVEPGSDRGDPGAHQLPSLVVSAERESPYGPVDGYKAQRSATATRLDLAIEETPAALQVLPRRVLEDTGAERLEDALDLAAGVQEANSFGNTSDGFLVRGFDALIAEDGVLSEGPVADINIQRDSAVIERVEVVRGPNAALFGPGSPGGIVNIVTKRPQQESFLVLDSQASSFERYRQTFDANLSLGAEGRLRARVSGAVEYSDSFRDEVDGDRQVVSPALTFEPTDALTLAYRGEYLRNEAPFDRGIPIGADGERLVGEEDFFGDPSVGDVETELLRHQLEVEYAPGSRWTARLLASWLDNTLEGFSVEPLATSPPSLPLSADLVFRETRLRDFDRELFTGRAELTGDVSTGPLEHRALLAFEWRELDDDRIFRRTNVLLTPPVDLEDPVIDTPDLEPNLQSDQFDEVSNYGFIAFDRVRLWEPLTIVAGVRLDFVDQTSVFEGTSSGAVTELDESEFSPTFGVVFQPFEWGSIFVRYSESFQVNLADAPGGGALPPQEGEGLEGGVRIVLRDGALALTATVFDIELENVPVADPFTQFARPSLQESRGIEVVLQGDVTESLSLIANYTYIDAEISDLSGLEGSSAIAGVPDHEASFFANYEFRRGLLEGLSLRGGIFYTDDRLNTVPQRVQVSVFPAFVLGGKELDPFVRVDAGLSYQVVDWLSLSFRVRNLFDEEHERPSSPDFALPGAPRVFSGGLSFRF